MRKTSLFAMLFAVLLLASCADNKVIDGVEYRPYGFINESTSKNDSIHYEIASDACISGIVFFECAFIPPIYVFGFNLYEPVCKKSEWTSTPQTKGVVQ